MFDPSFGMDLSKLGVSMYADVYIFGIFYVYYVNWTQTMPIQIPARLFFFSFFK